MAEYKINHFVSELLLKPWKVEHNSNRGIWCYDFEDRKISHRSSKQVFARRRVFTPANEKRYNRLIETPFSRFLNTLTSAHDLANADWEIHRALYLIFLAQSPRVAQALNLKSDNSFSLLLDKDDHFLDLAVAAAMTYSQIVRVRCPAHQPLFCPLIGIFSIPYQDPGCHTRWSYAFGIPLSPDVALVMLSKSIPVQIVNDTPLWACSVGLPPHTTTVAIHPEAMTRLSEQKIIETILFGREMNLKIFEAVAKTRELVEQVTNYMGLILEPTTLSMHDTRTAKVPKT